MKTPREWMLTGDVSWLDGDGARHFVHVDEELIAAIQSDARAGMVPEGELATLKSHREADIFLFRQKIARLEAELAKAWEAGRDAAAELADAEGPYASMAIRALQPPGGKAK